MEKLSAKIPKLEIFDASNETNDNRNTSDGALLVNNNASNHQIETGDGNSLEITSMANEHRILMEKYFQIISFSKNGTKITVICMNCQRNMRSDSKNYSSIIDHLKVCALHTVHVDFNRLQFFQNK